MQDFEGELIFIAETVTAIHPNKGTRKSAGFDLYLDESVTIEPNSTAIVSTGISIKFPTGYYGKIEARSSAVKEYGIIILAGVVDEDYTGIVKICVFNPTKKTINLCYSDCIAQIVIQPYFTSSIWLNVDKPSNKKGENRMKRHPYLPDFERRFKHLSSRNDGGFGSTNCKNKNNNVVDFVDLDE